MIVAAAHETLPLEMAGTNARDDEEPWCWRTALDVLVTNVREHPAVEVRSTFLHQYGRQESLTMNSDDLINALAVPLLQCVRQGIDSKTEALALRALYQFPSNLIPRDIRESLLDEICILLAQEIGTLRAHALLCFVARLMEVPNATAKLVSNKAFD